MESALQPIAKPARGRPRLGQASRVYFVKLSLRTERDAAVIAMLDEVEPGDLAGFVRFVLTEQARREERMRPGTSYLADELEALLGVRPTVEQAQTIEITLNVLGESVAGFLHALRTAGRMQADGSTFSSERVKAWAAGLNSDVAGKPPSGGCDGQFVAGS